MFHVDFFLNPPHESWSGIDVCAAHYTVQGSTPEGWSRRRNLQKPRKSSFTFDPAGFPPTWGSHNHSQRGSSCKFEEGAGVQRPRRLQFNPPVLHRGHKDKQTVLPLTRWRMSLPSAALAPLETSELTSSNSETKRSAFNFFFFFFCLQMKLLLAETAVPPDKHLMKAAQMDFSLFLDKLRLF